MIPVEVRKIIVENRQKGISAKEISKARKSILLVRNINLRELISSPSNFVAF